jgi:DNA-binding NarL/FixJ family response regulator
VARGRSNRAIAQALFIGEGTVKTPLAPLRDRVQAVVFAHESGLVRRDVPPRDAGSRAR